MKITIPRRKKLVKRLALTHCALLFGIKMAIADTSVTDFNIAAQPLSDALHAFSQQSNIDVVASSATVSGRRAPAVLGQMTAEQALQKLLEGSGLSIRRSEATGVLIIQSVEDQRSQNLTSPLFAQSATANSIADEQTSNSSGSSMGNDSIVEEEIVVMGFRRSLESALETKRNAASIVDSISSEGIGRFPDLNLGESLQRITGVQIERGERRRAEIAIRGLPRKFALTRINNQAMATTDIDDAFAFGVFESAVFNGADVIKTPTAAMDDGGLSGIVNIKTLRPLSADRDRLSVTVGANYEDLPDELSPGLRISGNKLFSDSLGGFFSGAWSDQNFRRDVAAVTDYDPNDDEIQVADDFRYRVDTTEGDRISLTSGLEWELSEEWKLGVTGVYTEYEQTTVRDQIRIRNCDDTAVEIIGNTAVRSQHENCRVEAETRERKDFDDTWALTFDAQWTRGPWIAEGVLHYTEGNHDGNLLSIRQRINDAPGVWSVNTGSGSPGNFRINVEGFATGDIATWSFANDFVEPRFFPDGANAETTDTEFALQFDLERELEWGLIESIQGGVKYRDRKQESVDQDASNDAIDLGVLDDNIFRESLISGSDFFGGDLANFDLLVPDIFSALDRILPLDTDLPLNDEGFVADQDFLATFDTSQEILAGYIMLNFDSRRYKLPIGISGNFGVRVVQTDRDTDTFQEVDGDISTISVPYDYDEVLPALNLAFELTDNLLLRTSYTETIVRPNPGDFQAGTEVSLSRDTDDTLESVSVEYGNPELDPFQSDSIDISLEWYNRPGSALTFAYFHKEIASDTIERTFCPSDLSGFDRADAFSEFVTGNLNGDIEDCLDEADVTFRITDQINSSETFSIEGFEIGLLQNFDFLQAPFDKFGVQANYTFIDADESGELDEEGNAVPLEEVSEDTANLILYYETDRWGVRLAYNYRSEYFTTANRGPSGGNRSIDDRDQWDLSVNFEALDNLSFGFEAFNINNADVYEFENNTNRLRNYSTEGRTFSLSTTYSF